MRRIVLFILAIILATVTFFWWLPGLMTPAPEKTTQKLFSALQSGNTKKAERYTTNGLGLSSDNRRVKKIYQAMFGTIRYTITDCTVNLDRATVTVAITMVDMQSLLSGASRNLLIHGVSGKKAEQKQFYQQLIDAIRSDNAYMVTNTVPVALIKQTNGDWLVETAGNDPFILAITGGLGVA